MPVLLWLGSTALPSHRTSGRANEKQPPGQRRLAFRLYCLSTNFGGTTYSMPNGPIRFQYSKLLPAGNCGNQSQYGAAGQHTKKQHPWSRPHQMTRLARQCYVFRQKNEAVLPGGGSELHASKESGGLELPSGRALILGLTT